jgi:hypothetical protein
VKLVIFSVFRRTISNTTDPLHVRNLIIGMLFVVIDFQLIDLIHDIVLNIKIKIKMAKLVKFHVTSGVVCKTLILLHDLRLWCGWLRRR